MSARCPLVAIAALVLVGITLDLNAEDMYALETGAAIHQAWTTQREYDTLPGLIADGSLSFVFGLPGPHTVLFSVDYSHAFTTGFSQAAYRYRAYDAVGGALGYRLSFADVSAPLPARISAQIQASVAVARYAGTELLFGMITASIAPVFEIKLFPSSDCLVLLPITWRAWGAASTFSLGLQTVFRLTTVAPPPRDDVPAPVLFSGSITQGDAIP